MHHCSVEAFTASFNIMSNPIQLICDANQKNCFYKRGTLASNGDVIQLSWVKTFKEKKGFNLSAPKSQP